MKQKLLTLVILLVMTTQAFADDSGTCGDNATWTLNETTGVLTISGTGKMTNYTSPTASKMSPFFRRSSSIKQVIIQEGITSIGDWAFYTCSGLTSINIPNSVTSIGDYAFSVCSGLTSINIPNSVISIGDHAFSACSGLTSVTIPNSVTSIGNNPFAGCGGLTSIKVETGNTKYDSRDNCNAIINTETNALICGCENTIIPNSVTSIGDRAFLVCSGLTSINIPNSVISIGDHAFSACSGLTSVTIGNSVSSIEDFAFYNCIGLRSIYALSSQPPTCSSSAFDRVGIETCTLYVTWSPKDALSKYNNTEPWNKFVNIETIEYGECGNNATWTLNKTTGVLTISGTGKMTGCYVSDNPFYSNKSYVKQVVILEGITSIGNYAFKDYRKLTSVNIPNSVTNIGDEAFEYCSGLTSITIPNSVTSIGEYAFLGCHLTDVNIEIVDFSYDNICYNLAPTVNYLVDGKVVTALNIPDNVTSIGSNALRGCTSLTSVYIPNSVTNIGSSAFSGCSGLTSINVPNSVKSIGTGAFESCNNLTDVNIEIVDFSYDNICYNLAPTVNYLVDGKVVTALNIPDNVTSIGRNALRGCANLTSVYIPNSVTNIGSSAFSGCSGLTSINVSNSVKSIGTGAFDGVNNLCDVNINIVDFSKDNVLYDKFKGEQIHYLYEGKIATNIVIPNTVRSIGNNLFRNSKDLTSVTIPNSITSIGSSAFSDCSRLTSIKIPNSVTTIGNGAFQNCSGFTSVYIGTSVTSIGEYAFAGCTEIEDIYFPTKRPFAINSNVFVCQNYATVHVLEKYLPVFTRHDGYDGIEGWRDFFFFENYVEPEDPVKKHDPNGDGNVNSADVVTIYNYIISSYGDKTKYDVNGDGNVNSADVVAIYNFIINGAK